MFLYIHIYKKVINISFTSFKIGFIKIIKFSKKSCKYIRTGNPNHQILWDYSKNQNKLKNKILNDIWTLSETEEEA